MSEPISVTCPMCGVSMNLKDRSKLGKKASCPNCRNVFVLAEGGTSADQSDVGASATAVPGRRPASEDLVASGVGRDSSSLNSGGDSKTGLILVGAVAVVLLVGVGLWASGIFSAAVPSPSEPPMVAGDGELVPANNVVDLAYLPADAELIVRLELADAWQTPLIGQLADQPSVQEVTDEIRRTLGLAPADVESLTIGLSDLSQQTLEQKANANPAAVAATAREKFTAVARLNKVVDAASLKLVDNGCKELQHNGQVYYVFQPPDDAETKESAKPLAVYLAKPQLVVLGSEERIQAAMASGGKQTRRTEFDFVEPDRQLTIVFVPKDKATLTGALRQGGGPDDPTGEMAQLAAKNLQALAIGVNVSSAIELHLQANCTDPKAASDMKQLFDGLVVEGRHGLRQTENPLFAALAAPAETVLSSVKTSLDSATVNVSADFSEQTIASLKKLAPFAMFALMGAMPDFGNGNPRTNDVPSADPADGPVVAPIPGSSGSERNK